VKNNHKSIEVNIFHIFPKLVLTSDQLSLIIKARGAKTSRFGGEKMNRIQSARQQQGITQGNLAKLIGVERSTVSKWETGKSNPRVEMLPKLADMLKCTVDDLVRPNNDFITNKGE
jgi:transcriptional regulator, XRE family